MATLEWRSESGRAAEMPVPSGWNAEHAVAACQVLRWRSQASRFHGRKYEATDPGGSLSYPGRYHRTWPTLYTSLRPEAAIGEFLRHSSESALMKLTVMRLSTLSVELEAVLDCRDPSVLRLSLDDLLHDTAYGVTQEIGAASLARGVEGILVPSATRLGHNLVLWMSQIRPNSRIAVVRSEDPRLYVPRS